MVRVYSNKRKRRERRVLVQRLTSLSILLLVIGSTVLLVAFLRNLGSNSSIKRNEYLERRDRAAAAVEAHRQSIQRQPRRHKEVRIYGNGKPKEEPKSESSDEGDDGYVGKEAEAVALEEIASGKLHLIDLDSENIKELQAGSYQNVIGEFCRINWSIHKENPSLLPMFRDLLEESPGCEDPVLVDLRKAVQVAQARDQLNGNPIGTSTNVPKLLDLPAVVFHESRCGSTLAANIFAASHPRQHRVYSEAGAPLSALHTCGDTFTKCSMDTAAQLFQDTLYLMRRTNDSAEQRAFFKIQSITSQKIEVFRKAFPQTPWLYIFRDPVQVMMSHLSHGTNHAKCTQGRRFPPKSMQEIAAKLRQKQDEAVNSKNLIQEVRSWSPEEFCAAKLATLTESAVASLTAQNSNHGIPLDYLDMPDRLYKEIMPNKLGLTMGEAEIARVEAVAGQYSKGSHGRAGAFTAGQDSQTKESSASPAIRDAAQKFLEESYRALQQSSDAQKAQEKQQARHRI